MYGFHFRYRLNGDPPTVERLPLRSGASISQGDMLTLSAGGVALAATGDNGLLGSALEAVVGNGSKRSIRVITDADAVYAVTDDNARALGDSLNLTGATGAQGIGDSLHRDLSVIARSAATDATLVRITADRHAHRQLTGGQLNGAIARAVVRIHRDFVDRGPVKAQAFFRHNLVVVILQEVMTRAERTLAESGEHDAALAMRERLHKTMRPDLVAAVERLTGRKVVAFMSDSNIDPDLATEVFVLDKPVPGERTPPGEDH